MDAAMSVAVTGHSTTCTCSPNIATAATPSAVAAALTTANDVNAITTPISKPTNCTPVLDGAVMYLERRRNRGPVAKGQSAPRAWTKLPLQRLLQEPRSLHELAGL
ncbi:hypothetical protein ON010_g17546 [Phytophthora cinnamomi]|nr:hypothetical protein ON010_g17546 [Phytophthora cinnamomi]